MKVQGMHNLEQNHFVEHMKRVHVNVNIHMVLGFPWFLC